MITQCTKRRIDVSIISLIIAVCLLASALVFSIVNYPSGKIYPHSEVETEITAYESTQTNGGARTWKTVYGTVTRPDMEYGELRYTVYLPDDYDSEKEYPFMLYLHGGSIGYRRTENVTPWSKDLKTYSEIIAGSIGDCIILAPQAPGTEKDGTEGADEGNAYWSGINPKAIVDGATVDNTDSSPYLRATEKLISEFLESGISHAENVYKIDESRLYLAGHSQGAIGSYTILRDCPDVFAAAIIGAGVGDPDTADKWKNTSVRIIHGTEDPTVLYEATKLMGAALKNNPNAEIITLSANHNIKPYMYTPENFLWMAEKDLDEVKTPYNIAIITLSVAIIAIGIAAALLLTKKKRLKASAKNIKPYVDKIQKEKIIAIVRGVPREKLIPLAKAMYDGGIRLIECTYDASGVVSDEEVAAGIEMLAGHFGDEMVVGAGTVLTKRQALLTKKAGGKFIISPDTNPGVIRRTTELGLVSIPGALTPSEIAAASRLGADFVKIFPIGAMGCDYIKDVKAPLSNVKLLAVGGVDENNMKSYFDAGAVGIGIGSGIVKKKMIDDGDFEGITALARLYTERLNG